MTKNIPAGAVDCHAHVTQADASEPQGPNAAHSGNHSVEAYLDVLDGGGISRGVLTAPSFYGTDNSLLLSALARSAGRLRGTATVAPSIDAAALGQMHDLGVDGIRLNYIGRKEFIDLSTPDYQRLFSLLCDLDMHVELWIYSETLPQVAPHLQKSRVKVVLDHFGGPQPKDGTGAGDVSSILELLAQGRTWVKLSAPFRQRGVHLQPCVDAFLDAGGEERLVWASDWPFVRFEDSVTYAQCIDWLFEWIPDERIRNRILVENPKSLFGFS